MARHSSGVNYVARPRIIRHGTLDPSKRGRQHETGAAKSRRELARNYGVIRQSETVLRGMVRELGELRRLASTRQPSYEGVKRFNQIGPVLRAMESQVGWTRHYTDAQSACTKAIAHYEKLLEKRKREGKGRASLIERLTAVEHLCQRQLPEIRQNLLEARASFAPCFCPRLGASDDELFEAAAKLEGVARGRPETFRSDVEGVAREKRRGRPSLEEMARNRVSSSWGSSRWTTDDTSHVRSIKTGKPRRYGRRG